MGIAVPEQNDMRIRPGVNIVSMLGQSGINLQPDQPDCTSHEEAQIKLHEKVNRSIMSNEYPGGRIEVRGDIAVLTSMAFSGGKQDLFGIEQAGNGYRIVDYPKLPDYIHN
ncbi:hypothetical protein J4209_04100 [Candidatus Woesearchaeota archaeon]|nr:hypothetical protein [Candidatus Woesearchaeota archaeon]